MPQYYAHVSFQKEGRSVNVWSYALAISPLYKGADKGWNDKPVHIGKLTLWVHFKETAISEDAGLFAVASVCA